MKGFFLQFSSRTQMKMTVQLHRSAPQNQFWRACYYPNHVFSQASPISLNQQTITNCNECGFRVSKWHIGGTLTPCWTDSNYSSYTAPASPLKRPVASSNWLNNRWKTSFTISYIEYKTSNGSWTIGERSLCIQNPCNSEYIDIYRTSMALKQ